MTTRQILFGQSFHFEGELNSLANAPTQFVEAMAGFSGREQSVAAIHAGGAALVSASHLVTAAGSSGR